MKRLFIEFFEKNEEGMRFWERNLVGKERYGTPIVLGSLCRQVSFMLEAGVTIRAAIIILAESPAKNRYLRISMRKVLNGIMGGESLSQALEVSGYFPEFMYNMCRIGEMADNLPMVMSLLADYYEEMARNRDDIKSALLYPAVVAVMMIAMILAAVLYVLPHYALIFEISDAPLPILTQRLLWLSDLMITWWWIIWPVVTLLIMTPVLVARTAAGRLWLEYGLLNIPPISIVYRKMVNLHIVQAMTLLLQSGQTLADGVLAVSSVIANKRVQRDLQRVVAGLQEGVAFWVLLGDISYIDPAVASMVRVGEQTGKMAQVFGQASDYNRHQFRQMVKRLNKMVEPVITLVLGLMLGLVMLSIILPTFGMAEFIG